MVTQDNGGGLIGANVIIKGTIDGAVTDSEPQEKIFEVILVGGRAVDNNGKLLAIGNTVDIANTTYTNDMVPLVSKPSGPTLNLMPLNQLFIIYKFWKPQHLDGRLMMPKL